MTSRGVQPNRTKVTSQSNIASSALGEIGMSSPRRLATFSFRIQTARAARLQLTRGPSPTPTPYWTAHANLVRASDEVHATRRPSNCPTDHEMETEAIHANEELPNPSEKDFHSPGNDTHTIRRHKSNNLAETKTNRTYYLQLEDTYYLQSDILIINVKENNDQTTQPTSHYIPSNRHGSHPDQYTKPIPQPEKAVKHRPTAAEKKNSNRGKAHNPLSDQR